MIDIALIREKPDWVKEQIARLNDSAALQRIEAIVGLDKQRRSLLGESEKLQAARNKLNKNVGRLRGDKKLDDSARNLIALRAVEAIRAADYDEAAELLGGTGGAAGSGTVTAPASAMDDLMTALKGIGGRVEALNKQIEEVET